MKKIVTIFLLLSFTAAAQEFKLVRPGVEYAETTAGTEKEPVHINILRLDLKKVRLDVMHAFDRPLGVDTTSSIAKAKGAIAAINAGFFRLDKSKFAGEAAGALMIDNVLWSESYADRTALGILNGRKQTKVVFGLLNAYAAVGYDLNISRKFDGINRERKSDAEILLYLPGFGTTPETEKEFTELIFSDCRSGCKTVAVQTGRGGVTIPADGYVVTLQRNADTELFIDQMSKTDSGKPPRARFFDVMQTGDYKIDKKFSDAEDIVAGAGQLIANGRIEITWEKEKTAKAFAESRHPRTAVGITKAGKFLMVTVDGRQDGYSVGMTLKELADFLLGIGAVDAMNLDGGGSTTMVLEGKIMNKPSDKEGERKVSDALLVFPRAN